MMKLPKVEVTCFHLMDKKVWKIALINWVNSHHLFFSEGFIPLEESWCLAICKTTISDELHCVVCQGNNLVYDPSTIPFKLDQLIPYKYYYFTDKNLHRS